MNESDMSLFEVLVYRELCQNRDRWLSDRELAQQFKGVTPRTIRTHCLRLVKRGLVEQPKVFPVHRYRLSANAPEAPRYKFSLASRHALRTSQ
jgi:predicted DNA-binding transcriptional regulator